jgi:hypothetical protein
MQFSSSDLDLDVAGRPAPAPAPAPAQKPRTSEWELLEGGDQARIEVRYKSGKKLYRAIARLDDPSYQGLAEKRSDAFEACDEADPEPVDAYSFVNPPQEQYKRNVAAAVARSHMNPDQAALSDMRKLLREMENDLLFPYKKWQMERDRLLAVKREQAAARALVRLALLPESLSDDPEFAALLKEAVKSDL